MGMGMGMGVDLFAGMRNFMEAHAHEAPLHGALVLVLVTGEREGEREHWRNKRCRYIEYISNTISYY
jgi:hypothetical protein